MWLITKFGFFSVVASSDENSLIIRSRVIKDLERLRRNYLSQTVEILSDPGTDYPFRIVIQSKDLAAAMQKIVLDIDYSNFKDAVTETEGPERASIYASVWMELFRLQRGEWQ